MKKPGRLAKLDVDVPLEAVTARRGGDLGPSLVDGKIRYLSASQLERFDAACFGGCARKWWYRYVARVKEKETISQGVGTQCHAQVEFHLRTGDDVLGDITRAGRRFLPRPGPDLEIEFGFGEVAWPGPLASPVVSRLRAAGVPIIGFVDLRHRRGEYLDDDGAIIAEPDACEVVDWKTTKQIDTVTDDDGRIVSFGYAKTGEALAKTWQMVSYGELCRLDWPDLAAVRLSHGYFQTKGPRVASKRTARVPYDEIARRWRLADALVERMKSVAATARVEDVPANYDACRAYGGCSYKSACPRDPKMVLAEIFGRKDAVQLVRRTGGDKAMSLLNKWKTNKDAAAAAEKPETKSESKPTAEAVAGAREKLLADEKKRKMPVVLPDDAPKPAEVSGECAACGAALSAANTSRLPGGEVKHVGCKIEAKASAKAAAPPTEPEGCPIAGQTVELTPDEIGDKRRACPCGAELKIKPKKVDGKWVAVIPPHEEPAAPEPEEKLELRPEQKEQVAQAVLDAPDQMIGMAKKLVASTTLTLYLDAIEDGIVTRRLEDYVEGLCRALEEKFDAADIRCAPGDSPLGFGKWKGALSALVRAQPPEVGAYSVSSTSELGMVAFDALRKGARVVRGSR